MYDELAGVRTEGVSMVAPPILASGFPVNRIIDHLHVHDCVDRVGNIWIIKQATMSV